MLTKSFVCCFLLLSLSSIAQQANTTMPETGVKVMSYNIHHANPPARDSLIDIDAIVAVISAQNPDVVALQEVDRLTKRSGKVDQAKVIAEKLGFHYFFAKAMDYDGGEYGQAILSKYPLDSNTVHRLPATSGFTGEPRIMAQVVISISDQLTLRFASVHLDAQKNEENRLLQAEAICNIVEKEPLPIIVAGDFNATQASKTFEKLAGALKPGCANCAFTIPVDQPKKTIDFIMLDKRYAWEVGTYQIIKETYASDHLPVVSTLQLRR